MDSFEIPLLVGKPNIGDMDAFLARIEAMFERRWFSNNGPLVQEFEAKLAAYTGVKHCVCVSSGTVALEIVAKALGLSGEVIVPAYTFVATAHALQWQGITPVFADMGPDTYNVTVDSIERLITPRTCGIVGVHVWGKPCDTRAIDALAEHYDLPVFYDAAHAFACSDGENMVGHAGKCEIFSFHATKFLNSFEGGAIATNDDEFANKVRLMRNFGFRAFDDAVEIGTNGKMTEICAAMGLTSLESIDEIIGVNYRNYLAYRDGLKDVYGVSVIDYPTAALHNYQYIVVEVDPVVSQISRDALVDKLHSKNVIARKYFWPGCHRMEPYRSRQPDAWRLLPNVETVAARVIVLPTGQAVDESAVLKICDIIQSAVVGTKSRTQYILSAEANRDLHALTGT